LYELSNHLGSILTVISDRKISMDHFSYLSQTNGNCTLSTTSPHTYLNTPSTGTHNQVSGPDGRADLYTAEIISAREYSAYGAELPGYEWESGEGYRYGFNGQEKETSITGTDTHTSAEFWMYDSRLGRRWNVDPVKKDHESVYAAFANNPIFLIDPNGDNAGDYLNANGEYLGSDGENDDLLYVAEAVEKDVNGKVVNATNKSLLNIKYSEFQQSAFILEKEASEAANAETYKWLAHAINNKSGESGKSIYEILIAEDYSLVPQSEKNGKVSSNDNSLKANYSRAAIVSFMLGDPDPTGGAKYWDGVDAFDHRSEGLKQAKYTSHIGLVISWEHVSQLTDFYDLQSNKDKVNPNSMMNCVFYDTTSRGIEQVENGIVYRSDWGIYLSHEKSTKKWSYLLATGFVSGTMFWKAIPR
jgi:RHS repeat-associated protein